MAFISDCDGGIVGVMNIEILNRVVVRIRSRQIEADPKPFGFPIPVLKRHLVAANLQS